MSSIIIELARNKSVLLSADALTIPMESSTMKLAKIIQGASINWRDEHGAITLSDMSFGAMTLNVKALAALCKISIELIESSANTGDSIEKASLKRWCAGALVREIEKASLKRWRSSLIALAYSGRYWCEASRFSSTTGLINTCNLKQ